MLNVQLYQDILVCLCKLANPLFQICIESLTLLMGLLDGLLLLWDWRCSRGYWDDTAAEFGVGLCQFIACSNVWLELQHHTYVSV